MNLLNVIRKAAAEGKAIGHFNIASFDMLKAVSHVAREFGAPMVIGVSEGERAYLGVHHVSDMVSSYNREHGEHLFLNADHTRSLVGVQRVLEAGYDLVVFDASHKPLEENIRLTKEAVRLVKKMRLGAAVEGELGYIGASSGVFDALPPGAVVREEDMPTAEEAQQFVEQTGVDLLAPAVGNVHGMVRGAPEPALSIRHIKEICSMVSVPLVLHGGSGIAEDDMRAAVKAGMSMVHISTELRLVWRRALERALAANPEEIAPYKLMPAVVEEMARLISEKMKLFGHA